MTRVKGDLPELMPVLSPGKHRNPRRGACFMEFASYLAGEPWSDHPKCTHPVLAALARAVNDCSSDAARARLTPLIPSVIGLKSADPRWSIRIGLNAATAALPIAGAERQRALAAAVLSCEHALVQLDGELDARTREKIDAAFRAAPDAERWARAFIQTIGFTSRIRYVERTTDAIVRSSVEGIAQACVYDTDERLHDLLVGTIEDCTASRRSAERADVAATGNRSTAIRP